MSKLLRHKKIRIALWCIALVGVIALALYVIFLGRHYFSRRSIRQIQLTIRSYGPLSPLAVIFLILLSTIIPPLPLPVPLIEMAAGLIFGFWPGFFLVWISHSISSLVAFGITRFIGKRVFKNLLKNHVVSFYQRYIDKRGSLAVFITRATMAAPFNIISFLAGLTQMNILSFGVATAFGTIPESALFTFVGSILRSYRVSLWYIFIFVVVLGSLGPFTMMALLKLFQKDLATKRKN